MQQIVLIPKEHVQSPIKVVMIQISACNMKKKIVQIENYLLQYLKFENTIKILVFLNGLMRNRNKLYIDPLLKLELLYFG